MAGHDRRRGGGCCPAMDLMRSEEMQLVQLIIPMESAHRTVSYLGDLGFLQFKDVIAIPLYLLAIVFPNLINETLGWLYM